MSKNAFSPDGGPHRMNRVLDVSDGLKRIGEFEAAEMLAGYADLLRERESAKAAVTDEIAERVLNQYVKNCLSHLDEAPVSLRVEAMRAALEAVAVMLASATDKHLEQEQDDIDKILAKLGLTAKRARTECGYLRVNDILNHVQETLDALAEADSARVAMTDKYVKLASARVPDGWQLVPVDATPAMQSAGGHANSEWLNDNAPIGENRYGGPVMRSVWQAMLAAAGEPNHDA